eukprot:gene1305-1484_t
MTLNEESLKIRSLGHIDEGRELTHAYVDCCLPREERRRLLWANYGFLCDCNRCLGIDFIPVPYAQLVRILSPPTPLPANGISSFPSSSSLSHALKPGLEEDRESPPPSSPWPESAGPDLFLLRRLLALNPMPYPCHAPEERLGPLLSSDQVIEYQIATQSEYREALERTALLWNQIRQEQAEDRRAVDSEVDLLQQILTILLRVCGPLHTSVYSARGALMTACLLSGSNEEALRQCAHVVAFLVVVLHQIPFHPLLGLQLFTLGAKS